MADFWIGEMFDYIEDPLYVSDVAKICFFLFAMVIILGIGRIQDERTRWTGLFQVSHGIAWSIFAFLSCGWLNTDCVQSSLWMLITLCVLFGIIMHFKKDEVPGDPIVDIIVVLFYFAIGTAASLLIGYHVMLAFEMITSDDFWTYTYWSTLFLMSILTLFQGIEMHKPENKT